MRQQKSAGFVKRIHRQGTRNRRKSFQKFVQCFAALQIIEEGLNRHAGASKDGDAMHGFGVSDDRTCHGDIVAQPPGGLASVQAYGRKTTLPDRSNL